MDYATRNPVTKWPTAVFVAVAVVALGVALGAIAWVGWPWLSMANWRSTLASAGQSEMQTLLATAAGSGRKGIPYLTEALTSSRPEVAQRAATFLRQQMRRWQQMAPEQAAQNRAELAEALAQRVARLSPEQLRFCADVATEILAHPIDARAASPLRVTAACEKVIRFAQREGVHLGTSAQPLRGPWDHPLDMGSLESSAKAGDRVQGNVPVALAAELSGRLDLSADLDEVAGLANNRSEHSPTDRPLHTPTVSALTGRTGASEWAEAPSARKYASSVVAPNLRKRLSGSNRTSGFGQAGSNTAFSPVVQDARSRPGLAGRLSGTAGEATAPETDSPDRAADGVSDADPATLDTRTLMHLLGNADGDRTERIADELRQRGFSEVELQLARQLVDPDPSVRLGLCRRLLSVEGIDPVPWLLELAHDREASVRLTALGLLATTGDPALVHEVRQLAAGDPDPRVQQLGSAVNEARVSGPVPGGQARAVR